MLNKISNPTVMSLTGMALVLSAGMAHASPNKGDKIVFHTSDSANNQVRVYTDGGGNALSSYWTDCVEHNLTPDQLRMLAKYSENDTNSSCEDLGLDQQVYETGQMKWYPAAGEPIFINCRAPGALLRHHLYCAVFGLCKK